jgi:hypothetical protein
MLKSNYRPLPDKLICIKNKIKSYKTQLTKIRPKQKILRENSIPKRKSKRTWREESRKELTNSKMI